MMFSCLIKEKSLFCLSLQHQREKQQELREIMQLIASCAAGVALQQREEVTCPKFHS